LLRLGKMSPSDEGGPDAVRKLKPSAPYGEWALRLREMLRGSLT
jgi:hypothetical protein